MKQLLLITLLFGVYASFGQDEEIVVNKHTFIIKTRAVKNEWSTTDTIKYLYRKENDKEVYLLKYPVYHDGGGDCNNEYWDREYLFIQNDSLVFRTHHFQKTGIDPIPIESKKIYRVRDDGKVILIFDKWKYEGDRAWGNK